MNAQRVKERLREGHPPKWIQRVIVGLYPPKYGGFHKSTQANFYEEVTIRLATGEKTRRGKPAYQYRKIDLVGVIFPHIKQWIPLICGLEIKVNRYDLMNDSKMGDYLPFCDLFFIAVPAKLARLAETKATAVNKGVGIISIEERVINLHRKAALIRPELANKVAIQNELLIKELRPEKKKRKHRRMT